MLSLRGLWARVSLGGPGPSKACPWSPACSEVTAGCVETTLVKCHGNAVGCQPPGDESADAAAERLGWGQGAWPPSGPSRSLHCKWTAAHGSRTMYARHVRAMKPHRPATQNGRVLVPTGNNPQGSVHKVNINKFKTEWILS